MINADISQHKEDLFFVRFSDPNEDFGNKPYVPVHSIAEVRRRLYVRNRTYIIETLTAWLNQRLHAVPQSAKQINACLTWIDEVKLNSFFHVCDFIELRRPIFESCAPKSTSKFYDHYQKTIIPILDFCCQDHE